MTKQTKTLLTVFLMGVAAIMVATLLHVRREQVKVIDRVHSDVSEQLKYDGYDPDKGVVKVRIVK
jgi:hypothetical protein